MSNTSNFPDNTTAVYLTPQQAESFKKFCEHEREFDTLLANGIFNIHNGKATLNFDSIGIIQKVIVERTAYIRKSLTNI